MRPRKGIGRLKPADAFSLKGKVAFVTGGLGLIGAAITEAFARSGAAVVVLDMDEGAGKRLQSTYRKRKYPVFYEDCDIIEFGNIASALKRLEEKYGAVDVWVNNAYPRTRGWGSREEEFRIEEWRKNVDMQLNSYCLWCNEVAGRMKSRGGSIINMASIYGVVAPDFTLYRGTRTVSPGAYSAIKGGIIAYTKYLASYFRGTGVRINAVCPGGVFNNQQKEFVKRYSEKTLIGRMATPLEVAWPVVFLASDAASYITGAVIMADGGLTTI